MYPQTISVKDPFSNVMGTGNAHRLIIITINTTKELITTTLVLFDGSLSTPMSSLYIHTLSGFQKQKVISELSENLNLSPCLSKYHAIKTYGGVEIKAPGISNLNIRCSLSFTFSK